MITQDDIDAFAGIDDTPLDMVREFTYSMGQPLDEKHGYNRKLEDLRWALLKEEFSEVRDAETPVDLLKELADLVYVTYGYAATYGWNLDEAVRRVHKSNMSKLGVDGRPLKRPDGKVLKGPNYKKPNLSDLV
jgi:predicted HAD superfamily Cof-like phosphohydrolase|tara:strand:- start:297 stop:695 length:399 start_codon:yes stop_codon:yes gene_type:complete